MSDDPAPHGAHHGSAYRTFVATAFLALVPLALLGGAFQAVAAATFLAPLHAEGEAMAAAMAAGAIIGWRPSQAWAVAGSFGAVVTLTVMAQALRDTGAWSAMWMPGAIAALQFLGISALMSWAVENLGGNR